jgi:hypothetical protein
MDPFDRVIAILEQMIAMKNPGTTEANPEKKEPNPEYMESKVEHREVPTEEAAMKSSGTMKKRHRGRHLAAERSGEPKKLTEEIVDPGGNGCRLQEGVPPCNSGMAQEKRLQEYSDPGNLWTAAGIGSHRNKTDPPCKSGTAKGTWAPEKRKRCYCTENPEGMYVQDETLEGPSRQNGNKRPRRQTAAVSEEEDNHERHRRVELRTVITSGKQRNAQDGLI